MSELKEVADKLSAMMEAYEEFQMLLKPEKRESLKKHFSQNAFTMLMVILLQSAKVQEDAFSMVLAIRAHLERESNG